MKSKRSGEKQHRKESGELGKWAVRDARAKGAASPASCSTFQPLLLRLSWPCVLYLFHSLSFFSFFFFGSISAAGTAALCRVYLGASHSTHDDRARLAGWVGLRLEHYMQNVARAPPITVRSLLSPRQVVRWWWLRVCHYFRLWYQTNSSTFLFKIFIYFV